MVWSGADFLDGRCEKAKRHKEKSISAFASKKRLRCRIPWILFRKRERNIAIGTRAARSRRHTQVELETLFHENAD